MATSEKTPASVVKAAYATYAKLRERIAKIGDNTSASEKASIATGLLSVLPTIRRANGDDGKKVRRNLRRLGHYISDDGYDVKFAKPAKRTRKAKANANVSGGEPTQPTADEANGASDPI